MQQESPGGVSGTLDDERVHDSSKLQNCWFASVETPAGSHLYSLCIIFQRVPCLLV